MRDGLRDKVVVITGASSGFGRGAALRLADEGAHVVLAARRINVLYELADICRDKGVRALPIACDVSNESDVRMLSDAARSEFGHYDVWINNAGGAAVGSFTLVPLIDHQKVIETDLMGTIYGSYLALHQFKEQGFGTLINVASMLGKISAPYYASYAAAKYGVVGLSSSLRQELHEENYNNIHVCTVLPMAMDTAFFQHAANYSGHEVTPIPPLDDAYKVVEVLLQLIESPKDEVAVGKGSQMATLSHQLAPALAEKMMATNTRETMEKADPAPLSTGALTNPTPEGQAVKGKFRACVDLRAWH